MRAATRLAWERAARRGSRWLGWCAACGAAGALLVLSALGFHAAFIDAPRSLEAMPGSVRLFDRSRQELARVRDSRGELMQPVRLDELSPWLTPALLAAEDARFFSHPGIDALALARALAQNLRAGRVVSGASTLTQQLARSFFERPRTLAGKWREAALALRLEAGFDKRELLEAYLNRVSFGPRVRGVAAASYHYFDKPVRALSLAEAATLAGLVRAPSRYDPERHPERLTRRRDHVLNRMLLLGWAGSREVESARASALVLRRGYVAPGAFHFVRAALQGHFGPAPVAFGMLHSTLDARLQAEAETLAARLLPRGERQPSRAAAVVVVENASLSVRAYVGSPDYGSEFGLGQNDGALALRQPGSALKPFVYALAMSELGLHSASLLADLPQTFLSRDGSYQPHNYDRRFHGPVRLAQALAASLNLPAVALAERLGPERVASFLREVGFAHLDLEGGDYGPAIALGVGEVQLVELVRAYASLARGGLSAPLRFFEDQPVPTPQRRLSEAISREISAVLSDPRERAATFGRDGVLEFAFPVALKTGTSKGNRDNWVVGFTDEVTVGVWVGNFDGSPLLRSSGATGAGPLFRAVLEAARRHVGHGAAPALGSARAEVREVCAISGSLAGEHCPHVLQQRFFSAVPASKCAWHGQRCDEPSGGCALVEELPARYAEWAGDTGRTLRGGVVAAGPAPLAIVFPRPFARFALDTNMAPERQEIELSARAGARDRLRFIVDGREVCRSSAPFKCRWALVRGRHELSVRSGDGATERVTFSVD